VSKHRTEAAVKKAVVNYLRLSGRRWFRMNSGSIPMAHNGKERRINLCPPGTPDFLVIQRGKRMVNVTLMDAIEVIWLEVKRPLGPKGGTGGSEQSDEQIAFQREAERCGERYYVVRSVEDVERALNGSK
jgi:hypothetical protein